MKDGNTILVASSPSGVVHRQTTVTIDEKFAIETTSKILQDVGRDSIFFANHPERDLPSFRSEGKYFDNLKGVPEGCGVTFLVIFQSFTFLETNSANMFSLP